MYEIRLLWFYGKNPNNCVENYVKIVVVFQKKKWEKSLKMLFLRKSLNIVGSTENWPKIVEIVVITIFEG